MEDDGEDLIGIKIYVYIKLNAFPILGKAFPVLVKDRLAVAAAAPSRRIGRIGRRHRPRLRRRGRRETAPPRPRSRRRGERGGAGRRRCGSAAADRRGVVPGDARVVGRAGGRRSVRGPRDG